MCVCVCVCVCGGCEGVGVCLADRGSVSSPHSVDLVFSVFLRGSPGNIVGVQVQIHSQVQEVYKH